MLNPVGRAGVGIFTPFLKAGDSASGTANWSSLDRSLETAGRFNGTVQLPAGPIYVDTTKSAAFTLNEDRAFVTILGAGRDKTLIIPTGTDALAGIGFASTLLQVRADGTFSVGGTQITTSGVPPVTEKYQQHEVVYFWKRATTLTDSRSARQRMRVSSTGGTTLVNLIDGHIGDGLPENPDDFMHIKGYAVSGTLAAGSTSLSLVTSSLGSQFNIGDDVLIGDGPGINEFYGEWVRVTGVSGGTITFEPPLQQSYGADLACVVPGRLNALTGKRQHMTDIVIRDISICAPTSGDYAGVFGVVRAGARIRFENVGFIASPFATTAPTLHEIAFATCGNVTIRDGFYDGALAVNLVQNLTIDNIVAGSLAVSEFCLGCNILNVTTTGAGGIQINGGMSSSVKLVNCTARVASFTDILAKDARIENFTAAQLNLLDGSTGVLVSPLAPDPTQIVDGTTAGSWLEPLQRQVLDRKVVSDADSHVTLELEARSGQSANLQEWQDDSGTVLVSISASGTFTILGSGSKTLTIAPAGSGLSGIDMFIASGGALRLGSSLDGGTVQAFSNSNTGFPGSTYIDCGNQSGSAIVFRTANSTTRFSITYNGDSVFVPPSSTGRGLVVRGFNSMQSGDLQRWEDYTSATLFAVRADGNLATAQAEESAPPGSAKWRLKIYDTGGTLIGYIPIYSS